MKLITYNILDGAVDTLPKVISIVKNESPDFLTLNEANTFAKDNNEILKEFAKKTNFAYFDIALSGEFDYHVAVFSKYPFVKVDKLTPLSRACLIVNVNSPLGLLSVASLHLSPFTEDLRNTEIDLILKKQNNLPNKILMGDMNSLSRYDDYDNAIVDNFNEGQIRKFSKNGKLRFDAIDKILSVGYFDAAVESDKNNEFTVPTLTNKDPFHSKLRLDYIFVSKPLVSHLNNYSVIKNDLTNQASDHYPVRVDLV